jgi:predicted DNA binding CopG/RHH family protein
MKYYDLDKNEEQTLKDYEAGKLKPVKDFKRSQKQYQQYTKSVLDKTKNLNIRIAEADLIKIKSMAVKKGIPYQTMLTSVIHQYSTGVIKEQ